MSHNSQHTDWPTAIGSALGRFCRYLFAPLGRLVDEHPGKTRMLLALTMFTAYSCASSAEHKQVEPGTVVSTLEVTQADGTVLEFDTNIKPDLVPIGNRSGNHSYYYDQTSESCLIAYVPISTPNTYATIPCERIAMKVTKPGTAPDATNAEEGN